MSNDSDDVERRKQQRLRALGSNEPKCGECGEERWPALEAHHVAGKDYNKECIVILCRNCHGVASDAQRDHPPKQQSVDPHLEMIGRFLLGLADLLSMAVERLAAYGRELISRAKAIAEPEQ